MKVNTILDNIDNGAIALPEFQRGYVWNRPQVRGLMDSLYRGHPVGSLLTWLTLTESAVARGDGTLQPGTVQLLLDGQQRITTLYGLIRGEAPKFFDGNSRAFEELRFHLDEETFEFWQPVKMRDDPLWIDVCSLFQQGAGKVIEGLVASHAGDPRLTDWLARINRIDQIRERDFHIEQVSGDEKTVDVVVEIFNRVNSGGTKLSKGDLALAKVCAEWPAARHEMQRVLGKWKGAGFDFTLDWLLRVVNAIVTGKAPFSALGDVPPADVADGLTRAEKAVDKILNALGSRLGLNHGSILPAAYPFVVLAKFIDGNGMSLGDHAQRDRLLYWYVQASMWGRYAGSTETVLAQDLTALTEPGADPTERLLALLRQQRGDLTVKPDDFWAWSRGARFFPILYMLTRVTGARDWLTGEALDQTALGTYSNLEIHHIFPKKVLYDANFSRAEVNAIANFTFLTQETNRRISDTRPEVYLPDCMAKQPGAVDSHWIPLDRELWKVENYTVFLEHRRVLLAQATNAFLTDLHAGHAPERPEDAAAPPIAVGIDEDSAIRDDDELGALIEAQSWLSENGFDPGTLDHELVDASGVPVAMLDLAWPRGLQPGLSDPVALLLNEPAEVVQAATEHGYRPFTDVEKFRAYAEDLLLRAAWRYESADAV